MLQVENYEVCLAELKNKRRNLNLLLGNGFSIAYDHEIFSYNALQTFIDELKDPVLNELFRITRSKNLEVIMQQLRVVSELLKAFGDSTGLSERVIKADAKLRKGLIDAVKLSIQSMFLPFQKKVLLSVTSFCIHFLKVQAIYLPPITTSCFIGY